MIFTRYIHFEDANVLSLFALDCGFASWPDLVSYIRSQPVRVVKSQWRVRASSGLGPVTYGDLVQIKNTKYCYFRTPSYGRIDGMDSYSLFTCDQLPIRKLKRRKL